jgi:hypothetical protein
MNIFGAHQGNSFKVRDNHDPEQANIVGAN